eukprot:TRINITY_DN11296_c0_g1_i1.p1 TRINITY_DN11296_c0_g1~~TRINITY_DN11296_c0_g1_i1.p1  ORF type:complete len:199 (-),score=54.09 TRINITY_DN11296_c0_g1_i1:127-669(-)
MHGRWLLMCLSAAKGGSMRKSLHSYASKKRVIDTGVATKQKAVQNRARVPLLAGVGVFGFTQISAEEAVEEDAVIIDAAPDGSAKNETTEESLEEKEKIAQAQKDAEEKVAAEKLAAEKAAAERIAAEEAEAARLLKEKAVAAENARIAAEEAAAFEDTLQKCKIAALVVFVGWVVYLKT